MKKMDVVVPIAVALICAGLGLAQDQSAPLGDVARRPKTAGKAKMTLTEEGAVIPAAPSPAAGEATTATADANASAGATATPATAPASGSPAQSSEATAPVSPAGQKLLDLQKDEQKLAADIARLQQRLQENISSDARQAFQEALASDQADLEADKKQEAGLQKADTATPQQ